MTKIFLTIITVFFSVNVIYAQESYSTKYNNTPDYSSGDDPMDLTSEKRGYKGSVKSVITKQYDENADKYYIVDFSKYDSDGNIIEGREFDSIGEVQLIATYKYDNGQISEYKVDSSDGTLIEHISARYNSSGKMTEAINFILGEKISFKYNSNDSLVEAVSVDADGSQAKYTYEYDSDGNLIALTDYEDGYGSWIEIYEYDSDGNIISTESGDHEDSLTTDVIYKYDSDGNMIEEENDESKTTYKYDSDGNNIEMIEYENDTMSFKTTWKYDSEGNKVEYGEIGYRWDSETPWEIEYQLHYKYDSEGNILEEIEYEGETIIYGDTYKYDFDGNMIEYINYEDGEIFWKETYKYDSYGNVIEEIVHPVNEDDVGWGTYYEYLYDSYGNLIESKKDTEEHDIQYQFTYY